MTWNPTSHAKNIAVLVVNRDHSRFSQLGQLIAHDWKEYGTLFVKFEDGEDTFQDGLCAGDPVSPVRTYYHIRKTPLWLLKFEFGVRHETNRELRREIDRRLEYMFRNEDKEWLDYKLYK